MGSNHGGCDNENATAMPIDYTKYPPDWDERRARILKRANNCCENCGVKNHAYGARDLSGNWHDESEINGLNSDVGCFLFGGYDVKIIRVVLTIAHLDHDETNWDVDDDRLAAWCQRCHLQYDAPEKIRRRKVKKYETSLFPI